ncbi:hypothetical protein V8J36_09440 [Frigidibacter sp. MR17.14]|uniref:hypothetical protein n=1 Tax=Frigidibacter sp. MR17.14 TaxID=3126509 RepID=UPI003012D44D
MSDSLDLTLPERPEFAFPAAEGERLRAAYAAAGVILEYGPGGSTVLAAGMEGKRITAVESDPEWIARMKDWFAAHPGASAVEFHHAEIGATANRGVPVDDRRWRSFHRYPLGVWEQDGFEHPDVVLIDGRFRAGCLLATAFQIRREVTVLFDDYGDRPRYAEVERWVEPDEMCGRMAVYRLVPRMFPVRDLAAIMEMMTRPL